MAQVRLQPADEVYVSVQGGEVEFTCSPERTSTITINGVQWLVNNSALEDLNLSLARTEFSVIVQIGFLYFTNLTLGYNMTNISCEVNTSSGMIISSDSHSLLLIQGNELLAVITMMGVQYFMLCLRVICCAKLKSSMEYKKAIKSGPAHIAKSLI